MTPVHVRIIYGFRSDRHTGARRYGEDLVEFITTIMIKEHYSWSRSIMVLNQTIPYGKDTIWAKQWRTS